MILYTAADARKALRDLPTRVLQMFENETGEVCWVWHGSDGYRITDSAGDVWDPFPDANAEALVIDLLELPAVTS